MGSHLILMVAYMLPVGAVWVGVLKLRPVAARVRVEREVLEARDRVMDAILAGEIEVDNPRAQDALMFCDFISEHAREITFTQALATVVGTRKAGIDLGAEAAKRERMAIECTDQATAAGNRCLQERERDIDHALARYLVRGSTLWWLLAPLQTFSRWRHARRLDRDQRSKSRHPSHRRVDAWPHHLAHELERTPLPGELATEMRESSRGAPESSEVWLSRPVGGSIRGRGLTPA